MKKLIVLVWLALVATTVLASDYGSLDLLNSKNLASYFNDYLGFVYDSHGCLHFTPADIYLLSKTIQPGTTLTIKSYQTRQLDFALENIQYLADLTSSEADLTRHQAVIKQGPTEIVVYPGLDLLFIIVNGSPYAKVKALAGPKEE